MSENQNLFGISNEPAPEGMTEWQWHMQKIAARAERLQDERAERERLRNMSAEELRRYTKVEPYDPGPLAPLARFFGRIGDWFTKV